MENSLITICRKWNNPEIKSTVTNEEIKLEMNLNDFKEALLLEIGSVTWTMTRAGLKEKVDAAFEKIVREVKRESSQIMAQANR